MEAILNLIVIAFAGLIAYWWATQGLFSAVLHLICVLCAGVLAFATWDPITDALLNIPFLQPYAKGIALLLPFGVYLLVLRLSADKLAPDNINFPHAVNLSVGGALGAAAGILTVGIAIIGIGHLHSSRDLLGAVGSARTDRNKGQPDTRINPLWIPVHTMTGDLFAWLSGSSFQPTLSNATLASEQPQLGQMSLGLYRDTFTRAGRLARTAAAPGSIRIDKAILADSLAMPNGETIAAYLVDVHFDSGATTEGQGFAVSASQLRLIGNPTKSAKGKQVIAYPIAWAQPNANGGRGLFLFDDKGHFVSSPAGTQTLDATLVYAAAPFESVPPSFLSAMGLQLRMPQIAERSSESEALAMLQGLNGGSGLEVPEGLAAISSDDLLLSDSITPASADLNNLGSMDVKDKNYLFQGIGEYDQGGFRGNKSVIVKGIWAPPNTRVVRLNISRGPAASSIDLWNDRSTVRDEAGENPRLALVDDLGREYFPIGYIHAIGTGDRRVNIRLERSGAYYKMDAFPNLSSAGSDRLFALFTPGMGRKIVGIRIGDKWVASADLDIPVGAQ
jgi:hypothetical protein